MSSAHCNGDKSVKIRHLPMIYDHSDSNASALSLIYTLFPNWKDDEGPVTFTRFTDGITNTLLKATKVSPRCSPPKHDEDAVLLRAYGKGTEILIDRDQETKSHATLASLGLAPPLLASFQNGLIYKFIPGRVCTAEDLTNEPVWRGVAKKLGEWHARLPIGSLTGSPPYQNGHNDSQQGASRADWDAQLGSCLSGLPTPNVWTVMQKWIHALPRDSPEKRIHVANLQEELLRTVRDLAHLSGIGEQGFVFSHNDLLSGNVIVNTQSCHKARTIEDVSFIDYEYSAPAPAAFDLANHFAEWGGFECKYEQLPTRSQRRGFIQEYLRSYRAHKDAAAIPNGNSHQLGYDESSTEFFETIDRFRGVPGLYWGIWALIQAIISDIDFDYTSYAEKRLNEYWCWRAEEDGSRLKGGQDMPMREQRWHEE